MLSHFLKSWLIPVLGFCLYKLLSWTWRCTLIEHPDFQKAIQERRPMVLAHWHGDELALISLVKRYRICTMVSTSKDGEIMNRVLHFLGGTTSRGSSTRGAVAALRGLLRLVKDGYRPSVAVDGPKGPIYKVKPGVFEISKIIDGGVYPVGVATSSAWVFHRSWNKTYLPKPFAKVVFCWGSGVSALSRDEDPRSEERLLELENHLNQMKQQAQDRL